MKMAPRGRRVNAVPETAILMVPARPAVMVDLVGLVAASVRLLSLYLKKETNLTTWNYPA